MNETKTIDVTDYLFQKLCHCIIFDEDMTPKLEQFSYYLEIPHFWEVFIQELSFLLSRYCLLEEEVNRIYYSFYIARNLNLDDSSRSIINDCIGKLNIYRIDMNDKYCDDFYAIEMKKRFPYQKIDPSNIEYQRPSIQASIAMDFSILWSLIVDDEDLFKNKLLPSFAIEVPYISNIRAFAYEMPELFTAAVVYSRLEMLIKKWEEDLKEYSLLGRIRGKQLIKQYKDIIKEV